MEALAFYYALGRPRHQVKVETEGSLAEILKLAHEHNNEQRKRERHGPQA